MYLVTYVIEDVGDSFTDDVVCRDPVDWLLFKRTPINKGGEPLDIFITNTIKLTDEQYRKIEESGDIEIYGK